MVCFSREGVGRLAFPIHNSNLEYCFRLGRNYALAATETVRCAIASHDQRVSGECPECQEERFETVGGLGFHKGSFVKHCKMASSVFGDEANADKLKRC